MCCLFVVILCGVKFDEVEVIGEELVVVGFMLIEVLMNLFDFFDSIVCFVCCFEGCVIVGVGIVLWVEDVMVVVEVGGMMIIFFNVNFDVICVSVVVGFVLLFGIVILIEVFVVLVVGVIVFKLFLVEVVMLVVVKVMLVVLLKIMCILLVGGIVFDMLVLWCSVGVVGFGLGFVFYKFGMDVVMVGWNVWVFVVVLEIF